MDILGLEKNYIFIVVVACLIIGYCIKHIPWLDKVSNQYIPTILAVIGAVLGCIANGCISLDNIVYGALSGLASIGLHQTFKTLIMKDGGNEQDDNG